MSGRHATKNGFGQLAVSDIENNIRTFIRRNYFDIYSAGLSEYVTYDVFNWWNMILYLSIYYAETKTYTEYLQPHYSGWGGYTKATNEFTLNKKKSISAQLTYEYNYPSISGESKVSANSNLSFGAKFLFFDKKLQLVMNVNNLLRSDRAKITNITQEVYQTFNQYYDSQYIRLSLSYKFGNNKLSINESDIGNAEEKNRAN
jgi:hypothetical protein